jgi:hypothetical protein
VPDNPFDFSDPVPPPTRRKRQTRAEAPRRPERRTGGPNRKLIYILASVLGGIVLLCCGGVGLLAVVAKKAESDYTSRDEVLTADFYPFKEGTKRTFSSHRNVQNEGKDAGYFGAEKELTHESGNVIQERTVKSYMKAKGDPEYHDLPVRPEPKTFQYRQKDGYVEIGNENPVGTAWRPIVKIGAKKGDKWEREVIPGCFDTYRLVKFEMKELIVKGLVPGDKVFCAYVEITHIFKDLSGHQAGNELLEVVELGRGVGPLQRNTFEMKGGRRDRELWFEVISRPSRD